MIEQLAIDGIVAAVVLVSLIALAVVVTLSKLSHELPRVFDGELWSVARRPRF